MGFYLLICEVFGERGGDISRNGYFGFWIAEGVAGIEGTADRDSRLWLCDTEGF
jgi:hypothetical protein